ncbi:hypothetical protein [Bradyrhizobium viridifuturi]|uniref:hypothetical protein n=1 Tax=Bradyrhizobium viridifuturi TaxID=1654716 RepID=UPI00067F37E8|nr:hypothetical protein [Bradyrhizobium viridifuturi]
MSVVSLADYQKEKDREGKFDGPMCITLCSPEFVAAGVREHLTIRWTVNNGDVFGALESVRSAGGIGLVRDGRYVFIPWPCAAVIIHSPDDDVYGFKEVGDDDDA